MVDVKATGSQLTDELMAALCFVYVGGHLNHAFKGALKVFNNGAGIFVEYTLIVNKSSQCATLNELLKDEIILNSSRVLQTDSNQNFGQALSDRVELPEFDWNYFNSLT